MKITKRNSYSVGWREIGVFLYFCHNIERIRAQSKPDLWLCVIKAVDVFRVNVCIYWGVQEIVCMSGCVWVCVHVRDARYVLFSYLFPLSLHNFYV